jgi:pimeloyl-ACP methyl ester carboxylesterase
MSALGCTLCDVKVNTASAQRFLGAALTRAVQLAANNLVLPHRPDEVYRVPTDDGAAIALGRYHPRTERRFREPVILCHGLGANRFSVDFDERYSLARFLARRGYETWVLELRGRGLAGPTGPATFDDQAEHDVAAAIRTVRSTGADRVTWVGHSKGGMVLYGHLGKHPEAPVQAAVAIGTPATFTFQPGLKVFTDRIQPALGLDSIPVAQVCRSIAPFGIPPGPLGRYLAYSANMDPEVAKRAISNAAANIPGGVARQFALWVRSGRFTSMDGQHDYHAALDRVRIPMLLIAGSKDLLAPPLAVAHAKNKLAGPVKFAIAGKQHGCKEDYGHGDLILGRNAPDEIFPRVDEFLSTHSTPC